jgi:hypothetical protein
MRISNLKIQIVFLCAAAAALPGILFATKLSPSGGDDTSIVQTALTAGAAITLSGTLKISKTLTAANGTSISGGQLLWTGPVNTAGTYAISFGGTGLTITGVTFNGAGASFNGASSIKFTNNTLENISGGTPTGITFTGLANSSITGNTFANIPAIGAIFGYNPQSTAINGNTIRNVGEGMHILWNNASGTCSVSNNDISGFSRHGIELQGDPQNLQVNANYVHDPAAAASHIWMSIATGGETTRGDNATAVVIHGNACTAPAGFVANPQVNYCMLEAMGNGTQVTGNYFAGGGWGGLVTDNPNMTWSNNQCHAVAAGVPYTQEQANPAIGSFNAATHVGNTSDNIWSGTLPAAIAAAVGPVAIAPALATTQPTQGGLTLTDNKNGTISGTSTTAISSLMIAPATANSAYPPATLNFPPGGASKTFEVGGIPLNWVVIINGVTIQSTGGLPAVPAGGWSPTLILPAVSPSNPPASGSSGTGAPTITEVITTTVYSNGSATVTTQP